ncbi:efflux RND transporter permease subunit [Corallococcus macrosporus]|uniref:CzcA family heavy metal efflux protein n=1 Tax=Myxococcus fulvus (strain ATCC BAA-855 / HW-1) TaxID=483219 RepID=F8C6V2_MYXFH|nr:CusA/CzcA family heavy metal efflux RND transporter [Corallococcus macrosporus]AEI66894.1 CzcA family heavy metal efflux protein [Corallococcus macrosporus]
MIEALVRLSVRHRGWVLALTGMLALAGLAVSLRLELDAMPDITTNQVLVLTRAPGLTPEEVERLVTRPVEVALGGMPGLEAQRSLSRYGLSSVTAVFADDVDPYRARQLVQERLNVLGASLPPGVDPPELGPLTGGLGEVFHFTLSSPERTGAQLLELTQLRVAPRLRSVPGVVEVNSWGGQQRTLEIRADAVRLAQRGVTLAQLRDALERATGSAPGASLPVGERHVLIRAVARPRGPADLTEALIPRAGAQAVRLGDVAEVTEGALPRIGSATSNGRGETVYVMVQMLRDANALAVTGDISAALPAVRALLPEDVRLDVVYDRATLVRGTVKTVGKNLLEGGLLVVGVLFLLLGSVRAGLLVASAIPLSMLGATSAMVALDIPGNLMSLGAIDFGLLVDGAVVMVEGLFHRLAHLTPEEKQREPREHVEETAVSLARPVFFSVLIILLVYLPILSLRGVDGKMFRPMAMTVVFALATALVLSLTFIPAAASWLIRPEHVPAREPLLVRWFERLYAPVLGRSVRSRIPVAAVAVLLLGVGGWLFARAGTEFTPQLDEGDMVIQTTRAPDISLEAAVSEAGRMERALLEAIPEVRQVVSRVGSPAVATDIMGLEMADVFVALAPRDAWRPGLTRESLIAEMEQVLEARAPGGEPSFTQPIQMRFNELLGGAVTDVALSIYGEDLGELGRLARKAAAMLSEEPGAVDVRVLAPPEVPLFEVAPRPLDAARAGLGAVDVLEAVRAVRSGVEVGATWDGAVRVPLVLRLMGAQDAFSLAELPVPTETGGLVPLSRVADVRLTSSPGLVSREGGQRRLVVGFNVRGADLGSVVERARARVEQSLAPPDGYRLEWGGQYETLTEARQRLSLVLPAVALLIFAVLLFAFRRLRPALAIFANVPFACVGGMMALASRELPVSISAAVGFIALSGIAVLNGVVLMSREQRLEEEGHLPAEAVVLAARERARPVLMTALVAALGFIPMMLAQGVGAEVQRPLATVVVGGLVTSTLLTLVILPTLYPWFAGRARAQARA